MLGWRNVTYYFQVTVTSGLVFRIIISGAYLILFEPGIQKFSLWMNLGRQSVVYHPWVIVTLTSDLVFLESASTLVYISYVI